jgi:hypothetical protein
MSEFDKKISALTGGSASQASDEYVVARSGSNFKITGANVAAAATSVGTLSALTISGDLTVDTSTLKVDSANNRVGIGTATPSTGLDVIRGSTGTVANFGIQGLTINPRLRIDASEADNTIAFNPNYNGATSPALVFKTQEAERMRIDASGNVGIGTTSTTERLRVESSDSYQLSLKNALGNIAAFGADASSNLRVFVDGAERARIPAAGGFQCVNSISVGNATPTTSGAGITFPATQSASSNANTLDDYEEGTFTPSIGGTATYNTQTGGYTKIGRQVTVWWILDINLRGTGSQTTILGLPFTVLTHRGGGGITYVLNPATAYASINPYATTATTNIAFICATTAGAWVDGGTVFQNGAVINGSATYYV